MDTPPPATDSPAEPPVAAATPGRSAALRAGAYCLLLACLASVLMFWELGADALTGDEAQYALVVQNIKRSGDWLHVSPYPPTPYLQKPPLYFWLTAATYDLLGGPDEFAYRAWSAAAGVGAVVLTCVLGSWLLAPEIGALAGLLLATNRAFLLVHGARSGTFDALVTLFAVAAAVSYWAGVRRGRRGRRGWGWVGGGVAAGLASMAKPFVGVPLVALLALHALLADRAAAPLRARVGGPLLALLLLGAIAAPWCVVQWRAHGEGFTNEFFGRNMVDRALRGVDDKHVEDRKFYLEQVSKSSLPFLLAIPAAAYAGFALSRGPRRSEHALLLLLGAGWVALFSLSASKAVHYVYPAFPFLAISISAGAWGLWRAVSAGVSPAARPRVASLTAAALGAAFAFHAGRLLYAAIPADRSPHVPWEMYKVLAPAVHAGEARVAFYGFPNLQVDWRNHMRLRARDCYYFEQMRPGAAWLNDPGELGALLADPKPTLLIVSGLKETGGVLDQASLPRRVDPRFAYAHHAFQVLGTDLGPLLEPRATPDVPGTYLGVAPDATPGNFRLTATPPMTAPARLAVRFRLPPGTPAEAVRFAVALHAPGERPKTLEDHTARPTGDRLSVSAAVEAERWAGPGPHSFTITLRATGMRAGEPVAATLEEARLTILPHIPPEPHPRR